MSSFSGTLFKRPHCQEKWAENRVKSFAAEQDSWSYGRELTTSVTASCLPGSSGQGSWDWKTGRNTKSCTALWDTWLISALNVRPSSAIWLHFCFSFIVMIVLVLLLILKWNFVAFLNLFLFVLTHGYNASSGLTFVSLIPVQNL